MSTETAPTGAALQIPHTPKGYRPPAAWKPTDLTPYNGDTYHTAPFRALISRDYAELTGPSKEVWLYPLHSEGGPFTRPTKEARPELIEELLGTALKGAAILADIDDEPAHAAKRNSEPAFFEALERALERFKAVPGWLYYRTLRGARVGLILAEPADLDTYQEAKLELFAMLREALASVEGAEVDEKCKDLARGFAAPHIYKRGERITAAHAQLWTHPQDTPAGHVEGLAQRWRARLKTTSQQTSTRTALGESERARQERRREGARSSTPNSSQPRPAKKSKTYIPPRDARAELTNPELYELTRSAFSALCRLTGDEELRLDLLKTLDAHLMSGRRYAQEGLAWFERTLEEYAARYPAEEETRAGEALPEPVKLTEHPELEPLRRIFEHGDDLELAQAVIACFGEHPAPLWHGDGLRRYDPARGIWAHYGEHALKRIVASARGAQLASGKPYNVTIAAANAALKWCASLCGADTPATAFDTAPRGIVLGGRVFVYASRDGLKVDTAAPHHYAIHRLDVELSPQVKRYFETDGDEGTAPARPAVFCDRYLARSLEREPDTDAGEGPEDIAREVAQKIDTIGEWLGLALLGLCTREAVALIVHGPGSNGKSVLTDLVKDLFGAEQTAHLAPQKMGEKFSRAQLFGAAVNVVAEMPESDLLASDALKAVISGDTIEVERKNKDPFSFAPRAAHIFAANRLPASRDRSHGLWRRLLPISFHRIFTKAEADRTLGEALRAEIPALVPWALDKARGYLARGDFEHTALINSQRWAWREITDGVAAYYRERCTPTETPADGDTIEDLWSSFKAWAASVGLEGGSRMSLTAFSQHLAALPGVEKKRCKKAGSIKTRANLKDKTAAAAASQWNTP